MMQWVADGSYTLTYIHVPLFYAEPKEEEEVAFKPNTSPIQLTSDVMEATHDAQHLQARRPSLEQENASLLASKYQAIEAIEDRAFQILLDLGMIQENVPMDISTLDAIPNVDSGDEGQHQSSWSSSCSTACNKNSRDTHTHI